MSDHSQPQARRGLLAAGNFIVDSVVTVDRFPREEMLANILTESRTNGGGPYNVLCDLAALGAEFPLEALGLIGGDDDGQWIREDCKRRGIDTRQLHGNADLKTSHTYVVCASDTGRRTFFHHRGANSHLAVSHFDLEQTSARLLHIGYLMLLDQLDALDADGVTGAAQILSHARRAGMETSVDLVSAEHPQFQQIARAALPHVDHLILNELEAGRILGRMLAANDHSVLEQAASELLQLGVHKTVALHSAIGAAVATPFETTHAAALDLPAAHCRGANGAGDAFAAGYLFGTHEGWNISERLRLATCTAAASLSDPSPSLGVRPVRGCWELEKQYGHRTW